MIDAKAFGEELALIVKSATAPLIAENKALVQRLAALEKRLDEMPDIEGLVDASVADAIGKLPAPTDGRDGADGKSVTIEDVMPVLEARVDKFLGEIPAPKDGKDGVDGKDGAPGERGPQGEKGADGIRLAGALIDRDGGLVVTLTNGEAKALGIVVGKDGESGKDGVDGLGFDDLTFEPDEYGRPVAKFQRGDVVKLFRLPCIVDRGVFKANDAYLRGDAVSYGGCLWIAQKDAPEGRPDSGDGWRMAVKKGRDGRDTEAKKVL